MHLRRPALIAASALVVGGATAVPVAGQSSGDPTYTIPTPVVDQTVVVSPSSEPQGATGRIRVKLPGSDTFVTISDGTAIPVGSTVDARAGRVTLTSAPDDQGRTQTAVFYGGIFTISQIDDPRSTATPPSQITRLTLVAPDCGRAAQRDKKDRGPHLWGDGKGRFQTRGTYSAATVRGTHWFVENRCDRTFTRVSRGVVDVSDFVTHKTVKVRAPHTYTARKRRG